MSPQPASCRSCGAELAEVFADLGVSPLANKFGSTHDLRRAETFYPLTAYVCSKCYLVQLEEFESPEQIFGEYLYFSSYSDSWLRHCDAFAADMVRRFGLRPDSHVIEIASNDGYLLQYFAKRGIPVLGIEPAANVAEAARARQIPTLQLFFGTRTAERIRAEHGAADLLVANNVLAHVPDLNGFVGGMPKVLKPEGVASIEVPHLLELMRNNQFDTIYHEHFSYFSLFVAKDILARHGLRVFDVERLATHGGSVRVLACHDACPLHPESPNVADVLSAERAAGLHRLDGYRDFGRRIGDVKRGLLGFLIRAANSGDTVAGYGAPAKGNTLLNYCGVTKDLLPYTVDRSVHKQGRFLPGTRIPIMPPDILRERRPQYLLVLPWNLRDEISREWAEIRTWGGKFVTAVPRLEVW